MQKKQLLSQMALKGKSPSQIAREIGICENSMYNKLNGKRPFTVGEAQKICDVLGIEDDGIRSLIFLH